MKITMFEAERAARLTLLFGQAAVAFTAVGAAAARAAAEAQDFAARNAAYGLLPRSFVSVDAMHWTPPADGQGVPPWLA